MVYVYLTNISDKPAMDAAYATFFNGYNLPARMVQGDTLLVRPQQLNARVGIRVIARTPEFNQCPNPLTYYSVPEILHDSPAVASQAVKVGRYTYVGSTWGSTDPDTPLSSISPLTDIEAFDILFNLEAIAARAGNDRGDMIAVETQLLIDTIYTNVTMAIARFYNWTRYAPPAFIIGGGSNGFNLTQQMNAVFYQENDNYAVIPTPWPWAIEGLLIDEMFGLPIGTEPNSTLCDFTSMPTCAKQGYFYNSFPTSGFSSLGVQGSPFQKLEHVLL
jgi:hypothetical protein